MQFRLLLSLVPFAIACSDQTNAMPTQENTFTAVVGSIVGGDTAPVRGSDGASHVVYELELTNAKAVPATIDRIDVLNFDDGATILTLTGDALVAALHTMNAQAAPSNLIPPNEARLLFVDMDFASDDAAPRRLKHRLAGTGATSPASREPSPIQYELTPYDISRKDPPSFIRPMTGPGWLASNGCCDVGGAHRGAIQSVNGELWDSQRFAIDWLRVDEQGRLVAGDPADLHNWVGYGEPILAAEDGVVIQARDGLPDQTPGTLPDPRTITIETIDGNSVVIDHGNDVFSFYAHLVTGSVAVRVGDRVQAGQQIGLLGNSGNTSAPHLHFHVMTGPSPLGSDGIPYVFEHFVRTQRIDAAQFDRALDGGRIDPPSGPSVTAVNALPLSFDVIDFGGG
ncbi:MAG TPA: M23 family metallopeptidase [Candidatus Binatia bacterium]|nr:M23 family metallopeptidase [Candidatus Binatia bacterium]